MRESRIEPFASVENGFASWLNTNAKREPGHAPLVLVEITDDDLRTTPWPWTPFDFSLAVDAALTFSPSVLAIEPVLSWPSPDAQQITLLHHQLLRVPKLLLGAELGYREEAPATPQELPRLKSSGNVGSIPDFNSFAQAPAEQLRLAGALGFENLNRQARVHERVPLVFRHCGQVVPSFVLQAAMLWYGVTPSEVTVEPGHHIDLGDRVRIPIDAEGTMAIDFGLHYSRISVSDLILAASQKEKPVAGPTTRLGQSLALIARNDAASRKLDFAKRTGSTGELFALSIATIQQQIFIRRFPIYGEVAVIGAGMALAWFISRKGKFGALFTGVAAMAVYLLIALGLFAGTFIALPLILPLGLVCFIVLLRQLD